MVSVVMSWMLLLATSWSWLMKVAGDREVTGGRVWILTSSGGRRVQC